MRYVAPIVLYTSCGTTRSSCCSTATARRCSSCRSLAGTAMWLETGSPTIAAVTTRVAESGWWQSAQESLRELARTARFGRVTWRRRWRAYSGSRCRNVRAARFRNWPSEMMQFTTQFNAGLAGVAAVLALAHDETLARLAPTIQAFILVGLRKWPTLFAPEQRDQRALLEHRSALPAADLHQSVAGIARVEADSG